MLFACVCVCVWLKTNGAVREDVLTFVNDFAFMAGVRARLAGLTRQQLEEFAFQAAAELPRGSNANSWLNATLAMMSPVPAWAVNNVLLDEDLCAAILSHLDVCDHAIASVCRCWLQEWRALLVRKRMMTAVTTMPFGLEDNSKPSCILKLPDYLCISVPYKRCLMRFDEDGGTEIFTSHDAASHLHELAVGADGCIFSFDLFSLKLRRLRASPWNDALREEVTTTVRKLTDDEYNVRDNTDGLEHRYLQLCESTLYLIRPPVVEAFDATTLQLQRCFSLDLDIFHQRPLPFEAFSRSQLLSYIVVEYQLFVLNRSGQLVKLAPGSQDFNFSSIPFTFDVCEDRLYVLNALYDEHTDAEGLELLALTLEGHLTQPPVNLVELCNGLSPHSAFSLSASPEGIYIADYHHPQVFKVALAR